MRLWLAAMALGAAAVPASGAVLFQQTVSAFAGSADLLEESLSNVLIADSIWVGIDRGRYSSADWRIDGIVAKLWWDPMGGGVDENGNPIPALTGNEYIYSPECGSTVAVPICGTTPLRTMLAPMLLRVDFAPPPDFNICTPTFTGDTSDCAETYTFGRVNYFLRAAATGDVTFTFYDADPTLGGVPEPATWETLVIGFGFAGGALRRRRAGVAA